MYEPNTEQLTPPLNNFFKELLKFFLIALIIVLPIRFFIAQPFIVQGASMAPTFSSGDYLIVDQLSYRFEEPERGAVIIFRYPKDPREYFIKRIIGLPNETIRIDHNTITIINADFPEGMVLDDDYITFSENMTSLEMHLGNEEYFVLGDNRPASSDSRIWGILPKDNITGRALMRLFPFSKINYLPGIHTYTHTADSNSP